MLALFLTTFLFAPIQGDAAELRTKTDAVFADWNKADSPGCAVAVYRNGAIVYEKGFGMASLELSVPITPETVFDIGSTSKQFTAACIALLAADGKLGLDDDVRKYLPELHEGKSPITIRHLLNHTSGLRDYIQVMMLAGLRNQDQTTAAEAYAAITRQKTQNFAPGEQHLYSNTGYFLLAQIVERVSQKSLREFTRERIFAPLEMTHTDILDDCTRVMRNKAASYMPGDEGFALSTSDWEQTGDGAVQTTVRDLMRWDENFYTGKVGGAQLRETLLTKGRLNDGKELDYCAGLMTGKHKGLDTVSHGGAWVGFRAELLRFPAQHLSVVCLCNLGSMDASGLAAQVAEVWLETEMATAKSEDAPAAEDTRPAVEVAAADLAPLAGSYLYEDRIVMVALKAGELSISGPSIRPGALTPVGKNRFRRESSSRPLDVVFENGGMRFEFKDGRRWDFTTFEQWNPSAADIARFAGKYKSEEIGTGIELALVDGDLTIVGHRTLSPMPLNPLVRDSFASGLGRITFQLTDGKVAGFVIDAGRSLGLRYTRQ